MRSKADGFNWALVAVYGAAQPELKPEFLADLVRICGSEQLPILVGGDSTLLEGERKRTMIISTGGGHSCLILLLKAWI